MTYHRIDKGDGSEMQSTRERMIDRLEGHGYCSAGSVQRMEERVKLTGVPIRAETSWAYWEIRP
jgi:hypothetical protein